MAGVVGAAGAATGAAAQPRQRWTRGRATLPKWRPEALDPPAITILAITHAAIDGHATESRQSPPKGESPADG